MKFIIAQSPLAVRTLWYMYYIPMIFIPMFALLVALSLGKPEKLPPARSYILTVWRFCSDGNIRATNDLALPCVQISGRKGKCGTTEITAMQADIT